MSFTQELWHNNIELYQKTLNLPFNQELAAGTLSADAFCHYVIQDAHYLLAYGRALAVAAAKAFNFSYCDCRSNRGYGTVGSSTNGAE